MKINFLCKLSFNWWEHSKTRQACITHVRSEVGLHQTLTTSCVTSCYLRKKRTNIRYRPAPTQNWRNTNKVEPDAAVMLCFFAYEITIWIFTWFFKNNFRPIAALSKCRPVRPAPPHGRTPSLCLCPGLPPTESLPPNVHILFLAYDRCLWDYDLGA